MRLGTILETLKIISETPMSSYTFSKYRRISYSEARRRLKYLEKMGLAKSEKRIAERISFVYSITEKGNSLLRYFLREPLPERESYSSLYFP